MWMKFDGNCLLPSNLSDLKKAQFFVAGAEKEIRLVFEYFNNDLKLSNAISNKIHFENHFKFFP